MGTLVAPKFLSALDIGLRWYALFGNRPWVVQIRVTDPDVFVPAPAVLPFPSSPSSLPVYAGVFAPSPQGSRQKAACPATLQMMAMNSLAPVSKTFPIPGRANTLGEAEGFFRKYPWITVVDTQWDKNELGEYAATQGKSAEGQLRFWLLTIQSYDQLIFDAAVKTHFFHITPSMNTVGDLVVDILRYGGLSELRHILSALEQSYFGDVNAYTRFIPPQQRLKLQETGEVVKQFTAFHAPFDYSVYRHQKWFFYVARLMFPTAYGYSLPKTAVMSVRPKIPSVSFFSSIFMLVRRLMNLPDQMRDYELGRGEATWCKLQRELDAFVLNDPETLRGIFRQKETSSNPIEITLLDPSEDQKALVLRTLLDCTVYDPATKSDLPTYRCKVIRLIVKNSPSPGCFRLASLEDYEVLEPKKDPRREFRRIRFVDQW